MALATLAILFLTLATLSTRYYKPHTHVWFKLILMACLARKVQMKNSTDVDY